MCGLGRHVRVADDGPDDRFVGRFRVVRIGWGRERAVAAVYGGEGLSVKSQDVV
jgi:hypothetical protein